MVQSSKGNLALAHQSYSSSEHRLVNNKYWTMLINHLNDKDVYIYFFSFDSCFCLLLKFLWNYVRKEKCKTLKKTVPWFSQVNIPAWPTPSSRKKHYSILKSSFVLPSYPYPSQGSPPCRLLTALISCVLYISRTICSHLCLSSCNIYSKII